MKTNNQTPKTPRPKDRDGWLNYINGSEGPKEKVGNVAFPSPTAFTPRSVKTASPRVSSAPESQNSAFAASNIEEAGIIEDEEPEMLLKQELEEVRLLSSLHQPPATHQANLK